MSTFTGKKPKDTYDSILHVEDNDTVSASLQYVQDGYGNNTTIRVSTLGTEINNPSLIGTITLSSPLSMTNGGLGVSLSDPNADRILFWDDSAGQYQFLTLGTNLSITGTTLDATGGGALSDADYGDITVSGTGTIMTIDNSVVSYGKIQNVSATDKLLGRSTAGAGVIEEITCTSFARTILDDANAAATISTLGLGTLATQSGTFSGTSSGTNTGDQNLFSTIAVSGQSDVIADSATDTLTLAAGANITITTNAGSDTITIAASGGSALSDADYGDITVSGTGTVMTIDNDVVTYAKMQNVSATDRLLGRVSALAGDVEEIPITDFVQTILDDTDAATVRGTISAASSGANTDITSVYLNNTGLKIKDTNASHGLIIAPGSDLTADHTLTVTTGDADRTLTISGSTTLSGGTHSGTNTGDQTITLTGAVTGSGTGAIATSYGDTEISSIAGLTSAADTAPYYTGSGTAALMTVTSFARSILDDADEATLKATLNLEANTDYYAPAGTDVALADGGTGASLVDPNADRVMFWDDSAGAVTWLTMGTNLTITGTTLDASGGGGNTFGTIAVSGQSDVVADSSTDTLTLVAGTNVTITTDAATDSVTINASGSGGAPTNSQYITLATDATLSDERVLTGTANQITITDGGAGSTVTLSIPYNLNLGSSSTAQSSIAFFEDTDNGSNKITLTTPASIGADYTLTMPPDGGTVDYVLRTDGSGTTTWVAQAGGSVNLGLTTLMAQSQFSN